MVSSIGFFKGDTRSLENGSNLFLGLEFRILNRKHAGLEEKTKQSVDTNSPARGIEGPVRVILW